MARFWINYSISVLIEAETAQEAEERFWDGSYNELGCADIYINSIEEEKD